MSNLKRWMILAIVSSALLLIVMDMTILYTALPTLTHDIGATASEKLWIVNAYSLVMAGLLPAMGTLGDRIGYKKIFILGLVVFGLASLLAAFSPTPSVLIFARVLLAVGASMLMPATLSITRITFTNPRELGLALGIWSSVSAGGAGIGPIIGGFLLEHFWWGSVFLINIPITFIALIVAIIFIPEHECNREKKFDYTSSIQIMIALVAVIYGIKEFTNRDGSLMIAVISTIIGILAFFIFVHRQLRMTTPLIDISLFHNSKFTLGFLTATVSSFALIGIQYLVTQRLQLVEGMTPMQAGLFIVSMPISAFIAGPIAGLIINKIDAIYIKSVALIIAALGTAVYLMGLNTGSAVQITGLALLGMGLGAGMTTASHSIMSNAPTRKAGMAASIEEVAYEMGGAIGVAIIGSVSGLIYSLALKVPEDLALPASVKDSLDEALLIAEELPQKAADSLKTASHNAFDNALITVIWGVVVLLVCVSAAIVWIGKRSNHRIAK